MYYRSQIRTNVIIAITKYLAQILENETSSFEEKENANFIIANSLFFKRLVSMEGPADYEYLVRYLNDQLRYNRNRQWYGQYTAEEKTAARIRANQFEDLLTILNNHLEGK